MSEPNHPLRRRRIERGLSVTQLAEASRLPVSVVARIDEGRFEDLPSGVYARSYVKACAAALGIDPAVALAEMSDLLPVAPDPFPLLRELKGARKPGAALEWLRQLASSLPRGWPVLRVTLPGRFSLPRRFPAPRGSSLPRWLVAGIDAAALLALNAILIRLTAYVTGLPVAVLLQSGSAAVAIVCVVLVAMYFLLFEGIGGRTPGAMACGMPGPQMRTPLGLRTILLRTLGGVAPSDAQGRSSERLRADSRSLEAGAW